ncbi:MAG TPA: MFS transporter [Xanthobacteraceae bacterium]|jgi:sugar phosphate permease|nr:MFS transporter [Xanthobacteraceae bacterium]
MPQAEQARPSRGRWYILGLICLMYLITYLDRVNISTAAPEISKEFGFDKITMGWIFSAFVWAYAMFQVPGGWLNDRFGARPVLAIIVAYWSVMTAATAMASGWLSFVVFRFLFGAGEAGAFPGATRAMQVWYPRRERGLAQGLTHSASRLGAAIAPPIVVLIIAGGQLELPWLHLSISMPALGWRSVFYICGAAGFLWSVWWYLSYRNLPEEHGSVNRAELQQIRGLDAAGEINQAAIEREGANVPWGTLLRSPNMWAIMCAYFTYVYCLYIFLTWLPSYLVDFRHFTLVKVGIFASLPLFAGVIGDTVGGVATDWLLKKTRSARFARRAVAVVGLLGCAVFMVAAGMTEDAYTAVYSLTAAMFFLECTIGPAWAVPMDCGGKYSGTVSGMMNMAGNIGGALSPLVFGYLAQYDNWGAPFIVSAALLVAGAAVWAFWLDPDRSVVVAHDMPIAVPVAAE